MGARSKARRRALDILFESELRGLPTGGTLADRQARDDRPISDYTVVLVRGVAAHADEIDGLIAEHASGWTLDRMPAVDRNALRIGVFELLYADEVPDVVAVSEAVALVRNLSTDESPAFVNGVLGSMLRDRDALAGWTASGHPKE
jgi:transcription antitermination protein NusB